MSILSRFLQIVPIKLLIIVGYIAVVAFVNWLVYKQGVPVSKRCSPDYPDFSVDLKYPELLPDGGVREDSSGEIYPQGAWWKSGNKILGCPCSLGKLCLRKCCALGETWRVHPIEGGQALVFCAKKITQENLTDFIAVYEKRYGPPPGYDPIKVTPDHFKFYQKSCKDEGFSYKPNLTKHLHLTVDGTLVGYQSWMVFDQSYFCVEYMEGSGPILYLCDQIIYEMRRKVDNITIVVVFISITIQIILVFTLLVYALVPRLRRGYGTPVMCYLATEIVRKAYDQFRTSCAYFSGYQTLYIEISVQAWVLVVSYYMWSMAGSVKSRPRLLVSCGLAWGAPLALTAVVMIADLVPGVPDILRPMFGGSKCFIKNTLAQWLYYIFPTMAAEIINVVLCMAALTRLAASKRNSDALKGPDSSRHNANEIQWSSLYVKVGLILGVNYLIYNILILMTHIFVLHPALESTVMYVNFTRGVELFVIFICKKDILSSFFERVAFWRR